MKHVLMVAYFYPPAGGGGVVRTLGFVRHLPEFGFQPVVLTGCGTDSWVKDPGLLQGVENVETVRASAGAGSRVPRGGAKRPGWTRFLARFSGWFMIPDSYAGWRGPGAAAGLGRLAKGGIDAIYSTSPPDSGHLVARALARKTRLPWVADFRDPWVGLGYDDPPTPWHVRAHEEHLESVLTGATRVVAATEGTARWLARRVPSVMPRLRVIPNGYEEDEWAAVTPHRFEQFTVVHAGRISGGRTLGPFLAGLSAFLGRDPSRREAMRVRLYGPHDAAEEARVRASGLSGLVTFEGLVPHEQMPALEAGASLLLLLKHREPRFRDLVPGKLYEYIGARRPVLAVVPECPAAELVRALRLGRVADPESPERIADALEEAWAGHLASHPPEDEARLFTRRSLSGRLAAVLEEALA